MGLPQPPQDKVQGELPQYPSEHKTRLEVKVLPLMWGKTNPKNRNIVSLFSTSIDCRLTLVEILKVRPHLWIDLAKTL